MSRSSRGSDEAPVSLFSFQDIITSLSGIMIFLVLIMAIEVASQKDTPAGPEKEPEPQAAPPPTPPDLPALRARAADLEDKVKAAQATSQPRSADPVAVAARQVAEAEDKRLLGAQLGKLEKKNEDLTRELVEAQAADKAKEEELAKARDQASKTREEAAHTAKEKRIQFIPERGTDKTPWLVEYSGESLRVGRLSAGVPPTAYPNDDAGRTQFLRFVGTRSADGEFFVFMAKPSGAETLLPLVAEVRAKGFDAGYDPLAEDETIEFQRK